MRALISVYDKTGLDEFARGLDNLGFELVASGGTAGFLEELGLQVTRVEDVTHAPELLGGRVKTLHPRIHGGILARRDSSDDLAALDEQEIEPFDVVCVNFYPFSSITARRGARMADTNRETPQDAAVGARAEYSTPTLVTYGAIAEITRAVGNTSNMDGGSVNGMKKSQP